MLRQRRRKRLRAAPFPAAWRRLLETRWALYSCLSFQDREELEGDVQVFLAEKKFEGCGGLEITDEIRVCIAAQACLLLLHRETDYYPNLHSVVVYPTGYFARVTRHLGGGILEEGVDARAGEAWPHGATVLAWDAVCYGNEHPYAGYNIVAHEFAHLLDFEDGHLDGAPPLGAKGSKALRNQRQAAWQHVLKAEYEQLRAKVERGENQPDAVLRDYAATNPAEFFAVATECFFYQPRKLMRTHPELYQELRKFFQQDPALWSVTEEGGKPIA